MRWLPIAIQEPVNHGKDFSVSIIDYEATPKVGETTCERIPERIERFRGCRNPPHTVLKFITIYLLCISVFTLYHSFHTIVFLACQYLFVDIYIAITLQN